MHNFYSTVVELRCILCYRVFQKNGYPVLFLG